MAQADKKTAAADLRGKDAAALRAHLLDLRKQQINMRFAKQAGTLERTHEIRALRREVARVKTILGEKA